MFEVDLQTAIFVWIKVGGKVHCWFMLNQLTDGAYVKSEEWMQRERNYLKAHLPCKGLTYNSISMPTRTFAGEKLSDAERLSKAKMNRAVYAIILKCTQPRRVTGLFV